MTKFFKPVKFSRRKRIWNDLCGANMHNGNYTSLVLHRHSRYYKMREEFEKLLAKEIGYKVFEIGGNRKEVGGFVLSPCIADLKHAKGSRHRRLFNLFGISLKRKQTFYSSIGVTEPMEKGYYLAYEGQLK